MKKYILIIILIYVELNSWGQSFPRVINWYTNTFGTEVFTNVSFTNENLPIFTETLQIEENQQVIIKNLVFENYTGNTNNIGFIPKQISFDNIRNIKSNNEIYAWIEFIPIINSNGQLKKLVSFTIDIKNEENENIKSAQSWKSNSVLSSGKWVKIKTSERGIQKVPYSQLENWGFSSPENVKIYGNGGYMLSKTNDSSFQDDLSQISIWHGKDENNDDCIFFYSTGTIKWNYDEDTDLFSHEKNDYSDYCYYYLSDQGSQKFVEDTNEETSSFNHDISTFQDYQLYENDATNVLKSGRKWYDDRFSVNNSKTYEFSFPNIVSSSPATISVESIGRSESSSRFLLYVEDEQISNLYFQSVDVSSSSSIYASTNKTTVEYSDLDEEFEIRLRYAASSPSSNGWLDFIEINATRNLVFDSPQLIFRTPKTVGEGNITRYNLETDENNLQIWDITDFTNPSSIPFSQTGSDVQFLAESESLREFIAFNPDGNIPEPEKVEDIENQDLHASSIPEMIIISHPNFIESAYELASFHQQNDNMNVSVVTTSQIYNEFSSGIADVSGIRNFLKMYYDKTNEGNGEFKYALLFGDGSYDNKNILEHNLNFIPTYQTSNSLVPTSSFVSDDFFALLDEGEGEYIGFIDIGIGRVPAKNSLEAAIVVDKIKNYASPNALGDWRNTICFISDDEDNNTHMTQTEQLADDINEIHPEYYTDKIYLDAYQEETTPSGNTYPDVNTALSERVKNGTLILNYTGHANEKALAEEEILNTNDIDAWTNYNRLPIFITATCEFSRFDDDDNSGGEHILFNSSGGGIGLFSTTRLVYSSQNFILNHEIYEHIFSQDENGENLRMGDVLRLTKNSITTGTNKRNFTLLGDPALSLSFPQYRVKTETINGVAIEIQNDTIKALSTVTITGKITDTDGNTLHDFNGEIVPIVYDKQDTVKTLGNNDETPFEYKIQNNIIYKGVTTVNSGEFEFSFIVPKDISYAVGPGKITYYANNGEIDANGYTSDFLIGGYSENAVNDNIGPELNAYLDDESFKSGDEVGKNSILYVTIKDETGINTIGTRIGHDITAVIDGNESNLIILNDYYLSDKDSYTSGSVIYPISGLEAGEHTITIKVWDVINNSSEYTINFTITDELYIEEVLNYPNPVNDHTYFQFIHNRPDESLDTRIEIYDYSGSMIDLISEKINSSGKESIPILWEVNDSQALIRNGAYLYRVIIKASDGNSASKTGKMIILKY